MVDAYGVLGKVEVGACAEKLLVDSGVVDVVTLGLTDVNFDISVMLLLWIVGKMVLLGLGS